MARQAGAVLGGLWETVGGGVAEPVGMGGEEAAGGGWAVIDFLSRRDREMLLLRFGVADGRPRTLGELGEGFRLTRERVRQIQEKALRRLRHPVRAKLLVSDFSRGLMARRGSLVVGSAQSGTPFVRFTSRCLRIPYVELHDLGVVVLGVGPEAVPGGGSGADWRTLASEDAVAAAVEARYGPYLSASDLAILVKAAMGVGK
jgi:hypothetical protein